MYSRFNPPKPVTYMRKTQIVRQLYDFARDDKDFSLIVIPGEKVNYDAMAQAAAQQTDFKTLKEQLRAGSIKITKEMAEQPCAGCEYGDDYGQPKNMIEVNKMIVDKAADLKKSYEAIPEDLRGGLTLDQFSRYITAEKLSAYAKSKSELPNVEVKTDGK